MQLHLAVKCQKLYLVDWVLQLENLWVVLFLHMIHKVQFVPDKVKVIQETRGRGHTNMGRSLEPKIIL